MLMQAFVTTYFLKSINSYNQFTFRIKLSIKIKGVLIVERDATESLTEVEVDVEDSSLSLNGSFKSCKYYVKCQSIKFIVVPIVKNNNLFCTQNTVFSGMCFC